MSYLKPNHFSILFIYIFILHLTFASNVNAQPKRLQFMKLTPDNGLSSSIISAILQDKRGFIWVGTSNGLNRYDGYNFVVYKNNPSDSASLPDNVVKTIFEDHDKQLFIGTETSLCLYDRGKNRFLNYMSEKSSPLRGVDCGISKIIEDSLGNLWLATDCGVVYFDRSKNQITRFTHNPDDPESLSNNDVVELLLDKFNRLWVTTRKGLNLFQPVKGNFKHFTRVQNDQEDLSNTIFTNIAEDKDGNIWFGSDEGLFCLKNYPAAEDKGLIHYRYDSRDNNSLSINQISALYVDVDGNLWIGTENGGINLFDSDNQRFWHFRRDDYDSQSLNNESIEAIYQDKTGNLWFGTYTGGLNIAVKDRDAIICYQKLPGAPFSLSHNTVMCFLEDHDGHTWLGTDGGGLNLFNIQTNHFSSFTLENSNLISNSLLCLLEDSRNQIWIGAWAGGLVHFDPESGSFKSLTSKNSSIQDNNIYAVEEGFSNDLWLGSLEHGLIHYQIGENTFTAYTPDNSGAGDRMVIKIVKYSKGRLLIGTAQNFQIFSPSQNKFTTFEYDRNNKNSLSYPRVTDILAENDTCIWIGTPDGLNRFNPVTLSFVRYYKNDGLPDSFIKGLVLDNSGVLWVTTNGGVCRFDYRHSEFKNFVRADGLQSNEFSDRSVLKMKNGALLMGGTKGFNIIYPEKIRENKAIPEVVITDFKLFNKSVKPADIGSPLSQNITETKSLTLSHKQSMVTFAYAVLDFSAPSKNKYAYKMENFDRDWIYPDSKIDATYTNLSPGNYIFHVKGSNDDGLWNETGTSINITILPPWWSTWWFRFLIFATVILMFTAILFLRVRMLKNQKLLLEKTVEIKTSELKQLNASKDKFFSIIAHDLKNPFNTIIGFSELLCNGMESEHPETTTEFAHLIQTSAIQTLRLLENLLDWANSQQGKIRFNPEPVSINDLIQNELDMLKDMAKAKNIELKYLLTDNFKVTADKNMIMTVLRNLISNAIKFTNRNGNVEVTVVTKNNDVCISVSDTGIGMTGETMEKLFRIDSDLSTRGTENEKGTGIGLFLCKEFVEKHNGRIWVESKPGKGSVFRFTIPREVLPDPLG
jgi:signal transduction histidine kinase/ligand-binding sensor domain-containing protein